MLKKLIGAAAVIGMLLFSAPASAESYKVKAGDTLFVNGYCDDEGAALGLYWQISQRSVTIPLEVPANCHPVKKGVVVEEVLAQSPSVRNNRSDVVMVKAVGEEDRWYIGFSGNVQPVMGEYIPLFTPVSDAEGITVAPEDGANINFMCKGLAAATVMMEWKMNQMSANDAIIELYEQRVCLFPMSGRSFVSTIAEVVGTARDAEGDIFALVRLYNAEKTAPSEWYALVWQGNVLPSRKRKDA